MSLVRSGEVRLAYRVSIFFLGIEAQKEEALMIIEFNMFPTSA
jgi:hypothetical protein